MLVPDGAVLDKQPTPPEQLSVYLYLCISGNEMTTLTYEAQDPLQRQCNNN